MTTDWDPWSYREQSGMTAQGSANLVGYDVEAADGGIGKVDDATNEVGSSYIVVDTGPWIFGKKVLLPANVTQRIDLDNRTIQVRLTKDQIKASPEFDENAYRNEDYRRRVGTYYGSMVELYQSKVATGRWDTGVVYSPPLRRWNFDTNFRSVAPPGSPDAVSWSRGTWAKW